MLTFLPSSSCRGEDLRRLQLHSGVCEEGEAGLGVQADQKPRVKLEAPSPWSPLSRADPILTPSCFFQLRHGDRVQGRLPGSERQEPVQAEER